MLAEFLTLSVALFNDSVDRMANPTNSTQKRPTVVAIVGGGITGATAAATLAQYAQLQNGENSLLEIHVLDQGRRGPGGRASHRSVDMTTKQVVVKDEQAQVDTESTTTSSSCYEFDHGCQFFRADTHEFQTQLLQPWLDKGWVAPWKGRFSGTSSDTSSDFFGIPTRREPIYIGVGGMHTLPQRLIHHNHQHIQLHAGTRVSSVQRRRTSIREEDQIEPLSWNIYGTWGTKAYHDTKLPADNTSPSMTSVKDEDALLLMADIVIFTDISSAAESWHRASAGIPQTLQAQLPMKVRLPLFSCMVALDRPVTGEIQLDGLTCNNAKENDKSISSPLWFAARSQSKPGFPQSINNLQHECWTLISTPAYAVDQITKVPMRDPITGAFLPQDNDYLNSIPGPDLFQAFCDAIKPLLKHGSNPPKAVYLQAQRWGSGLPVSEGIVPDKSHLHDIHGSRYASAVSSLVYDRPSDASHQQDFVALDGERLYYAGDFCSYRNPGMEAAALSGLDVAKHILSQLGHSYNIVD